MVCRNHKKYLYCCFVVFVVEVLIALFVQDEFIRPFFGDALVVILIYCFINSFFKLAVLDGVVLVLSICFFIEFLQFIHIVQYCNLGNNKLAKALLGTSFSWLDLLCYLIGAMIILLAE